MAMEYINGGTEEYKMASEKIIKWMGAEYTHGKMGRSTRGNIRMIRNMGLVSFGLQMVRDMKGSGKMANSMGRGGCMRATPRILKEGYGIMGQ